MRYILFICYVITSTAIFAQKSKTIVIEQPVVGSTNTDVIQIRKVELDDLSTKIYIEAYSHHSQSITVGKDVCIQSNGKRYGATNCEGIELGQDTDFAISGPLSFILQFPALPKGTKSIDLIEINGAINFRLLDIDLTGKKAYPSYPQGLPMEFRRTYPDSPLPDFLFRIGTTKINLRLLGVPEGSSKGLTIYYFSVFSKPNPLEVRFDEKNEAVIELQQYGSGYLFFVLNTMNTGAVWIAPGEELDIYIDCQRAMHIEKWEISKERKDKRPYLYANGHYAGLNSFVNSVEYRTVISHDITYGPDFEQAMTADQFRNRILTRYDSIAQSINSDKRRPQILKEYLHNTLNLSLLTAIRTAEDYLVLKDSEEFADKRSDETTDRLVTPSGNNIYTNIKKRAYFDTPKLLMGCNNYAISYSLDLPLGCVTDEKEGFLYELKTFFEIEKKRENNTFSEKEIATLQSLNNQFYAQVIDSKRQNDQKATELLKRNVSFRNAPDVELDKLFDAIIAPHKGKVILIDFWNTWCGPCRAALKEIEPLKEKELKSDRLVWMYIANESSPSDTYRQMIERIEGEHYRLNEKQWRYLCEKFNITGIPSYVLVGKDGQYQSREDFRDYDLLINTLKELNAK